MGDFVVAILQTTFLIALSWLKKWTSEHIVARNLGRESKNRSNRENSVKLGVFRLTIAAFLIVTSPVAMQRGCHALRISRAGKLTGTGVLFPSSFAETNIFPIGNQMLTWSVLN